MEAGGKPRAACGTRAQPPEYEPRLRMRAPAGCGEHKQLIAEERAMPFTHLSLEPYKRKTFEKEFWQKSGIDFDL